MLGVVGMRGIAPGLPIFPVGLSVFKNLNFYFLASTSCVEFSQFRIREGEFRNKNCLSNFS